MAEHTPSVGDFVIFRHAYGFDKSGPISRVTADSVFVPENYGRTKDRRINLDALIFVGDEEAVSGLTERLRSSAARKADEVREVGNRHRVRDEKMIGEARAALALSEQDRVGGGRG